MLEATRRTHATGEPFREEYRLIASDGRVVRVREPGTEPALTRR